MVQIHGKSGSTSNYLKIQSPDFFSSIESNNSPLKSNLLKGSFGEECVITELAKLSNVFHLINNFKCCLPKSIFWNNRNVRSYQIDHVVIGPTGIFLIEVKNWSQNHIDFTNFTPDQQINHHQFIFNYYLHHFYQNKDFFIKSLIFFLNEIKYLHKIPTNIIKLSEILLEITHYPRTLSISEIELLVNWICNTSNQNQEHLPFYFS